MTVHVGGATLWVQAVDPARAKLPRRPLDRPFWMSNALAFVALAALFFLARFEPDMPLLGPIGPDAYDRWADEMRTNVTARGM